MRHQLDGRRHAFTVMSITPPEKEPTVEAGQKIAKAFQQNRASMEVTPATVPEALRQIDTVDSRRETGMEQIEGRIEHSRPKAAFAFLLVAVRSPRSAGTGGSGNQSRTGGASKSRNRREGGIQGSGR